VETPRGRQVMEDRLCPLEMFASFLSTCTPINRSVYTKNWLKRELLAFGVTVLAIVIKGFSKMTQVVEHLSSKLKALSSKPSTAKVKTKWLIARSSRPNACDPSYSGGRDQKDFSSKPAQANRPWHPISKHPSEKRAGGVAQGIGPEFKP
jgi:hypothetical protein